MPSRPGPRPSGRGWTTRGAPGARAPDSSLRPLVGQAATIADGSAPKGTPIAILGVDSACGDTRHGDPGCRAAGSGTGRRRRNSPLRAEHRDSLVAAIPSQGGRGASPDSRAWCVRIGSGHGCAQRSGRHGAGRRRFRRGRLRLFQTEEGFRRIRGSRMHETWNSDPGSPTKTNSWRSLILAERKLTSSADTRGNRQDRRRRLHSGMIRCIRTPPALARAAFSSRRCWRLSSAAMSGRQISRSLIRTR